MSDPLIDDRRHLIKWKADLLDIDVIEKISRESGLIKRKRKFNPVYLIYVIIFGISCHSKPSFEEMYRDYIYFDDTIFKKGKIRIQSFYKRFNEDMEKFLFLMLHHYIDVVLLESPAKLKKPVTKFKDILIQDSTIIRLSKKLAEIFPAARFRGKGGGIKIHAVYSVISHSLKSVEISGERVHDSKKMVINSDVKESLLIFDLGYYSFKIFTKINSYGGFFVSRLKTNATPKVIKVLSQSNGNIDEFEEYIVLNDFLDRISKSGNIDLVCSFNGKNKTKSNLGDEALESFRVTCFWDKEEKRWHNYVTNLPSDEFSTDEIYHLYEYRWIIELLFKEMKSDYDLGHQILTKSPLAYAHIYSMLIRIVLSRSLYKCIIRSFDNKEKERYGPLLWSKIFTELGKEFLSILNEEIFGGGCSIYRWEKLESAWQELARSRHSIKRLSLKYISF